MDNEVSRRLTTPQAAAYAGLSASLLNKLRCRGDGPPYLKLCDRVLYDRADLDAWINAHRRQSTSEYEPSGAAA